MEAAPAALAAAAPGGLSRGRSLNTKLTMHGGADRKPATEDHSLWRYPPRTFPRSPDFPRHRPGDGSIARPVRRLPERDHGRGE